MQELTRDLRRLLNDNQKRTWINIENSVGKEQQINLTNFLEIQKEEVKMQEEKLDSIKERYYAALDKCKNEGMSEKDFDILMGYSKDIAYDSDLLKKQKQILEIALKNKNNRIQKKYKLGFPLLGGPKTKAKNKSKDKDKDKKKEKDKNNKDLIVNEDFLSDSEINSIKEDLKKNKEVINQNRLNNQRAMEEMTRRLEKASEEVKEKAKTDKEKEIYWKQVTKETSGIYVYSRLVGISIAKKFNALLKEKGQKIRQKTLTEKKSKKRKPLFKFFEKEDRDEEEYEYYDTKEELSTIDRFALSVVESLENASNRVIACFENDLEKGMNIFKEKEKEIEDIQKKDVIEIDSTLDERENGEIDKISQEVAQIIKEKEHEKEMLNQDFEKEIDKEEIETYEREQEQEIEMGF